VTRELEKQRRRIQGLQARLYAENERGLLIVLQAVDTGAKTAPSNTSSAGSTPKGAG
jgi:hypothetical protein